MTPYVVLACSARKVVHPFPCPALDLYTGPLFQNARAWALSVVPRNRIWILSAAWGLVPADHPLGNYDVEAKDAAQLAELLRPRSDAPGWWGWPDDGRIYFVGGAIYREALGLVFPDVVSLAETLPPGRETRGIGAQRAWLDRNWGTFPA